MAARQQHRFRGVILPTSSHPEIRRTKREQDAPSIHGNKLWKSSCLVIDYLHKNPEPGPQKVLDVGCGWGIGGIWCAKRYGASVTSVDADPNVFPFLDVTAELNGVNTKSRVARFEKLNGKFLRDFDTLIAADICFWDELVDPVANMVNRAVKAGVERIIIADPERPTFHEMAARCVDRHGGEVLEWKTKGSLAARGALLVINNY
ncbi:class I SAM-dependent methyltransferase [Congregibacter litoralis]|uniref:Ribosomal protein L11 methylase n=1 Tax=Congregibacter litoralis KT71 TaxID=314285 RepID=A4A3Y8_9GAMM|nr:methyltransferase domain-containing protein [Congregibacter litoralis]EAQ99411.2 Ribosomal protein L11 methylase [Congregibacter litoralis KT71]